MQELVHCLDAEGFGLEGLVLLHEPEKVGFSVGLEGGLHRVDSERLDLGTLLGALPGQVGVELGEHGLPFFLGDTVFLGEFHVEDEGLHAGESCLPGGVDAAIEGEFAVGLRTGEGIGGDFFGSG